MVRTIGAAEREALDEYHQELLQLASVHQDGNGMSFREYLDEADYQSTMERLPMARRMEQFLKDINMPITSEDREYNEQRVFMKDKHQYSRDQFWRQEPQNYQ